MHILIAEDDFTSRNMLTALLRKAGHDVTGTVNGVDAWEELQKPDAPRLAILDWLMPEMDGLEVVRQVRAKKTDRPPYLIMLTTKGEKANIISGLDAGADDYLSKPFDAEELRARVDVGCRIIAMQNELCQARDALAYEAAHDPLTAILNRRALETALSCELSRQLRHQHGLSVGICDIDYFKTINDTYGHVVGDEVLCGYASLLKACLRNYDHFGRIGGDEFLMIAPYAREDAANKLFEKVRMKVANTPIPTRVGDVAVTVSIGVRSVREGDTIDKLLTDLDAALYRAKNEGRNRVCLDSQEIAGVDTTHSSS